jgi:hypothetical protein
MVINNGNVQTKSRIALSGIEQWATSQDHPVILQFM